MNRYLVPVYFEIESISAFTAQAVLSQAIDREPHALDTLSEEIGKWCTAVVIGRETDVIASANEAALERRERWRPLTCHRHPELSLPCPHCD